MPGEPQLESRHCGLADVSLYIHIPFCPSFCDYCDFYSETVKDGGRLDSFLTALIKDINYQLEFFGIEKIVTAYIGGGTPSVLGVRRIRSLLDELGKLKCFSPVEFTIEANPESADREFLTACREGGITRLSLGAQSFHEPSRKSVNRAGSVITLEECLSLAGTIFPQAFCADLLAGLPYQTEEVITDDIKRLLEFKPSHVSLYSLVTEDGTPLEDKVKAKMLTLPDTDAADNIWLAGKNALVSAGFEHYEISNFSAKGGRCLHNTRYWLMDSWLGAGPAACGTVVDEKTGTALRFTYVHDTDAYMKNPIIHNAVCEHLDRITLIKESLLMGYRYMEGPDSRKFRSRFGISAEECIPRTLERWKEKDKMLYLNKFLTEAFCELEM
ncbi:MAG: radical SAM family heme chaperone HemW [Treponema sp.]|jgi:oxygen-independent coproporphyrinogen-3 oxidase|nr:radical SAM family heme chaperone HemW [Treponema sp.]